MQEVDKHYILSSCNEAEARIWATDSERERAVLEHLLDCSLVFRDAALGSGLYPSSKIRHTADEVRGMVADKLFDQTRLPVAWHSVQALFPAANRLLDFH